MSFRAQIVALTLTVVDAVAVGGDLGPIGLVLSGGGAKGAYEVGVWQALEEAGVTGLVSAISGTSAGALNAALFSVRPEMAESLWIENMGPALFTVNVDNVGEAVQVVADDARRSMQIAAETDRAWKGWVSFGLLSALRIGNYVERTLMDEVPNKGVIDSTPLANVLLQALPEEWPETTPDVYVTFLEKGLTMSRRTRKLNGESRETKFKLLLASAAMPVGFDSVRLDGASLVDGGWEEKGGDNVPLAPLLAARPDIRTVIVVYLDDEDHLNKDRRNKNRNEAIRHGVRLIEVVPTENLGGWRGVFDAAPATARRLMELGRIDAERSLRNAGLWNSPMEDFSKEAEQGDSESGDTSFFPAVDSFWALP